MSPSALQIIDAARAMAKSKQVAPSLEYAFCAGWMATAISQLLEHQGAHLIDTKKFLTEEIEQFSRK